MDSKSGNLQWELFVRLNAPGIGAHEKFCSEVARRIGKARGHVPTLAFLRGLTTTSSTITDLKEAAAKNSVDWGH